MSKCWGRLAFLIVVAWGSGLQAGDGGGIGVLGDSYSDEYQFYSPHRSTSRNWVEILAAIRGVDFGEFGGEPRDEPRNQGFAYNWARSAATSDDMIATGQHTGLAAQAASGRIRFVVVFIGGNDFLRALQSGSPRESLAGLADRAMKNLRTGVDALLAASPGVKVLVATVPDLTDLPEIRAKIREGAIGREAADLASAELEAFNGQVRKMAAAPGRVAVFDFSRLCRVSTLVYPRQLSVGGRKIDRWKAGNDLECLFLADQRHLGTVGQGWLAKAIVATLNSKFAAGIPPVEDREILAYAASLSESDSARKLATAPASTP